LSPGVFFTFPTVVSEISQQTTIAYSRTRALYTVTLKDVLF